MKGSERVLVVGGGTGIGQAVAKALLARGARVAVAGRRLKPLEDLATAHPEGAWPLPCDVTKEESRRTLLQRATDVLGGLDGFVYSAGNVVPQLPGQIDEAALRSQLEVNLVAPIRLAEEALTSLSSGGGIVFVSSNLAGRPLPTHAIYSAAKAGLLAAMKSLALVGAERKIRVNAVLPGVVETEMMAGPLAKQRDALTAAHPLGRIGRPEDVAQAVVYLLTQPWSTGTELVVDGGALARP